MSAQRVAEALTAALAAEAGHAETLPVDPEYVLMASDDLALEEFSALSDLRRWMTRAKRPPPIWPPSSTCRSTSRPCWAKSHMSVAQLLKLNKGSVLELDRKVGEAIDIFVNNRLIARGEVVVVDDRLGVTMTEIIKTEDSGV